LQAIWDADDAAQSKKDKAEWMDHDEFMDEWMDKADWIEDYEEDDDDDDEEDNGAARQIFILMDLVFRSMKAED
jgi:hypothetical protein